MIKSIYSVAEIKGKIEWLPLKRLLQQVTEVADDFTLEKLDEKRDSILLQLISALIRAAPKHSCFTCSRSFVCPSIDGEQNECCCDINLDYERAFSPPIMLRVYYCWTCQGQKYQSLSDQHLSDQHLSDQHLSDQNLSDQNLSDQNLSDCLGCGCDVQVPEWLSITLNQEGSSSSLSSKQPHKKNKLLA